jgi:ankyrin repeat protein
VILHIIAGTKPLKENSMNTKRILVCFLLLTVLALTGCGPSLSVEEASTLLLESTMDNDLAGVTRALKQGADVDTTEPLESLTPLIIASTKGYTEIATHLIEAGADVNATSKQGVTPLMGAAMNGHADLVTLLATKNTNLDQLSEMQYSENALHLAARNGHTAVIEALLKAGADVNALEGTHSTALMYAAYRGHLDAVELLIKQGAELNVRDNGGHTALYWAERAKIPEVTALISAAGGTE